MKKGHISLIKELDKAKQKGLIVEFIFSNDDHQAPLIEIGFNKDTKIEKLIDIKNYLIKNYDIFSHNILINGDENKKIKIFV